MPIPRPFWLYAHFELAHEHYALPLGVEWLPLQNFLRNVLKFVNSLSIIFYNFFGLCDKFDCSYHFSAFNLFQGLVRTSRANMFFFYRLES